MAHELTAEMPKFKPIQVPCILREGLTVIFCITNEELEFLSRLGKTGTGKYPKKEKPYFETTDLSDLIEKGILLIEEVCADICYRLSEAGELFFESLKKSKLLPRN